MEIGVASVVVGCTWMKYSHHYPHISSKTKCMPQLCKQSKSPPQKKKLIIVNIFTINEASCFILDDSDREKLCGYKIIPLINRRPLRHKMLIKQTNLEKFNVHDFDCVAVECNKNTLQ